jgi:tRNA1Val (adenine37-N6)-methyltransferase
MLTSGNGTTEGHLLGGRVSYRQPASGFRSGIEPVLLAASIPARPGERVLEAGTGAAAALLCLAARVPAIQATGVESDPTMAELATVNAKANGFFDIQIIADRIENTTLPRIFDHAMANPPYHRADGSVSPQPGRESAKRGSETLIRTWIAVLSAALRRRGTLTLIVPAGMVTVSLSAMTDCRCPCVAIFPLWPKSGQPAKLVLLRGIQEARASLRLMPGLVLHRADGSFSEAAQSLFRDAAALALV